MKPGVGVPVLLGKVARYSLLLTIIALFIILVLRRKSTLFSHSPPSFVPGWALAQVERGLHPLVDARQVSRAQGAEPLSQFPTV